MEWFSGFILPIIKVVFLGGVMGWIVYIVIKAFHNAWTKSWKFVWKYKIRKKAYPEKTMDWIFSCIDAGIGWYDAKKLMMVKMTPQVMIDETLWIFDNVITELNKEKGGIKKHGRKYERDSRKEIGNFPTI